MAWGSYKHLRPLLHDAASSSPAPATAKGSEKYPQNPGCAPALSTCRGARPSSLGVSFLWGVVVRLQHV